jgi:hypothetical protein
MDHSITEQLTGDPEAWHTTAIALSEGGEVSDLASRIAEGIFPREPRLRKWSAGRVAGKRKYRLAFSEELAKHLPHAKVNLLAISATEAIISHTREQLVRELRIDDILQEIVGPRGTSTLRVGPYTHHESGAYHFFEFPLNRALMIIWVAHFVARMHRMIRLQLQGSQVDPVTVDWFFYHDKFAGDSSYSSPAMSFFQVLVSANITEGNVRSAFFVDSDKVNADLFADNVAGLLNTARQTRHEFTALSTVLSSGAVYYEAPSPVT